jgi:hypothetical protein
METILFVKESRLEGYMGPETDGQNGMEEQVGEPGNQQAEEVTGEVVSLENVAVEFVKGDLVKAKSAAIGELSATTVELSQTGAQRIDSQTVTVHQGGAGMITADTVDIAQGGVGVVRARDASVAGSVGVVAADTADLNGAQAGIVVANNVQGDSMRSFVLLASQVDGNVETVLDTPRAILSGLVAGVAMGLVFLVGRLLDRGRR